MAKVPSNYGAKQKQTLKKKTTGLAPAGKAGPTQKGVGSLNGGNVTRQPVVGIVKGGPTTKQPVIGKVDKGGSKNQKVVGVINRGGR